MIGQADRVAFLVVPHRVSDWGIDAPDSVARLLRGNVL
jgi:hypothetical protein